MSFQQQMENQTELNNIFKGNTVNIVDRDGRVHIGREFAGCYVAIVIFKSPLNETYTKQQKEITYAQNSCKSDVIAPEVLRMYDANNNITLNELSDKLAVHRETIKRCVHKINAKTPGRIIIKGEVNRKVDVIIPIVKGLMNEGTKFTAVGLAKELGVDRGTVTKAIWAAKNNACVSE